MGETGGERKKSEAASGSTPIAIGGNTSSHPSGSVMFLPPLPRLRSLLTLLVSSGRSDAAYTRFMLLGFLLSRPYTKVEAMRSLKVSRDYLDRVLKDWLRLELVEVRDASTSVKPMMTVYLKLKPTIKITRLNGKVEEISDPDRVIKLSSILVTQAKTRILEALSTTPEGMTLGELLSKLAEIKKREDDEERKKRSAEGNIGVGGEAGKPSEKDSSYRRTLYKHLNELIASRLIMVLKLGRNWVGTEATGDGFAGGRGSSLFRLGFRLMEFTLEPHTYGSEDVNRVVTR